MRSARVSCGFIFFLRGESGDGAVGVVVVVVLVGWWSECLH